MQRSSATAGGCKPVDAGNSPNCERTHNVLPSVLQFLTCDCTREDVSPQVTTTVINDAALMQELKIGAPSIEIQSKVTNLLAHAEPPVDTEMPRQNEAQADLPAVDLSLVGLINKS